MVRRFGSVAAAAYVAVVKVHAVPGSQHAGEQFTWQLQQEGTANPMSDCICRVEPTSAKLLEEGVPDNRCHNCRAQNLLGSCQQHICVLDKRLHRAGPEDGQALHQLPSGLGTECQLGVIEPLELAGGQG